MIIVKWAEMKEVIENLNESGLTKKIKISPTDKIIHEFMKSVESIPVDYEDQISDEVASFYNDLVTQIEEKGTSIVLDVNEEQVKKKEKREKKIKKTPDPFIEEIKKDEGKKEKEKKKEKKPEVVPLPQREKGNFKKFEKDEFGSKKSAGTHTINMMFKKGATITDIAAEVGTPVSRVRNHYAHLKGKGYKFEVTKDEKGNVFYKVLV